jgi:hypothetical protein
MRVSPDAKALGLKWRLLKQAEKQPESSPGQPFFSRLQVAQLQPDGFSLRRTF